MFCSLAVLNPRVGGHTMDVHVLSVVFARLMAVINEHAHTHTHDGLSRRGRRIPSSSVRLAMGKQTNARGAWSAADVASPHHRPS